METHPPKLIERFVEILIPQACREHVMGDLYERYKSPTQYVWDALTTLPFLLVSRLRRTFRIELFLAEASVLYIALAGASLSAGTSYLYDRDVMLPLAVVIAVTVVVLTLADAYDNHERRTPQTSLFEIALALTCGFASNFLLGIVNRAWTLPISIMITGIVVSVPLLYMLRTPSLRRDDAAISGGGGASLGELRDRSAREYETAHRVKWTWLISLVVGLFTTTEMRQESGGWLLSLSAALTAVISLKFRRRPEVNNPYRQQLERKQHDLLFWAGSTVFGLLPGIGPALILLLVVYPLIPLFARWLRQLQLPANITPVQVAIAFGGCVLSLVLWLAVRDTSLRAARAIREELDEMDRSKDDKK